MRRTVPFIATALVSVMITAAIMQASAGAHAGLDLRATQRPASQLLGLDLRLETCKASPSNAAAWTKFAKCTTGNFTAIKKWATKLDNCLTTFEVSKRSDLATYVDGTVTTGPVEGLVDRDGAGPFRYFMGWQQAAGCPAT